MRTIEARLHSVRDRSGKGLTEAGVRVAREAAGTLGGSYHAYFTAGARRCRETLQALGFPTWEETKAFGGLPDALDKFEHALYAEQLRTGCRYMDGYLSIPEARVILQGLGKDLVGEVRAIAGRLQDGGRALVISHAETIEVLWMAARGEAGSGFPGGELGPLDGVAIDVMDDQVRHVRVVRLPGKL